MFAPPSPIPFAEFCQLQPQRLEVALFTSTTYKIYVSLYLHAQNINTAECLIDKGISPNLINRSFLHLTWVLSIKRRDLLKPWSANKHPLRSEDVILQHLQIDNLRIECGLKSLKTLRSTLYCVISRALLVRLLCVVRCSSIEYNIFETNEVDLALNTGQDHVHCVLEGSGCVSKSE